MATVCQTKRHAQQLVRALQKRGMPPDLEDGDLAAVSPRGFEDRHMGLQKGPEDTLWPTRYAELQVFTVGKLTGDREAELSVWSRSQERGGEGKKP